MNALPPFIFTLLGTTTDAVAADLPVSVPAKTVKPNQRRRFWIMLIGGTTLGSILGALVSAGINPLPLLVFALVGGSLCVSAYRTLTADRGKVLDVIRAWQWRYLPGTLASLAGVIGMVLLLEWLLPWTQWGWFSAIGGIGNPVLGEADLGDGPQALAISAALAVGFPIIFAVAAIREARSEEESFRKGNQTHTLGRRLRRSIWFGLIHCIIGIPLSAGLALTVMGLWFDYVYQRGFTRALAGGATTELAEEAGVNVASAQHAAINLFIIGIVGLALLDVI